MRLGFFGGAFDPLHIAHLRLAEEARVAAELDMVYFLPTAAPPHKQEACHGAAWTCWKSFLSR